MPCSVGNDSCETKIVNLEWIEQRLIKTGILGASFCFDLMWCQVYGYMPRFWNGHVVSCVKRILCSWIPLGLTNLTLGGFCKENQFFSGLLFVYLKKENTFAVRLLSLLADCIKYWFSYW